MGKIKVSEKQLINDPEVLVSMITGDNDYPSAIEYVRDKFQKEKTQEWRERGDDNTVRSSAFGTCVRRAAYSYLLDTPEMQFDDKAKERMYLGLVGETIFEEFIKDLPGELHTEQNEFPIHIEHKDNTDDFKVVATTDFVKSYDYDGEKYYIPIELKNTGMYKWEGFRGHDYHIRQLMTWVHIAKENNLNVPYGLLVYVRNLFDMYKLHEIKVITVAVDTPFRKMGRLVEQYHHWKFVMEGRMQQLHEAIHNGIIPPLDPSLPEYICYDKKNRRPSCPFYELCCKDELPTRKEKAND